jgi:hypothetical protein
MSQKIKINKCPLCGKSHRFVLKIKLSSHVFITGLQFKIRDKKNEMGNKMKQLITCPVTNRLFQATIPSPEDDYEYEAFHVSDDD